MEDMKSAILEKVDKSGRRRKRSAIEDESTDDQLVQTFCSFAPLRNYVDVSAKKSKKNSEKVQCM